MYLDVSNNIRIIILFIIYQIFILLFINAFYIKNKSNKKENTKIKMSQLNYMFQIYLFYEGGGSAPSELWTFIVLARYFTSYYAK